VKRQIPQCPENRAFHPKRFTVSPALPFRRFRVSSLRGKPETKRGRNVPKEKRDAIDYDERYPRAGTKRKLVAFADVRHFSPAV
jgi:hypothetical protein